MGALVWFLVRVIPKPSRAAYPCQRVAAPIASAFIVWLLGVAGLLAVFGRAHRRLRGQRRSLAALCTVGSAAVVWWSLLHVPGHSAQASFTPTDPPNTPMGVAKGIYPGRVSWVRDPNATSWDGSASHWWSDAYTHQGVVDTMMSDSLRWLTAAGTDADSWDRLFHHFNQAHGKGDVGYQAGEAIAIKINLNNSWSQGDADNEIDASPQTVRAMLRQLVNQAGVPAASITVYDAIRYMPDHIYNPCHAEFPGVRFVDTQGGNGRIQNEFVASVLHFSNGSIPSWASELARCLVESDYVINLAVFKRHGWCAPLTVCGKSHFGSVSGPGDLHAYVDAATLVDYDAQVDLIGHQHIGGKTLLFMLDGLYGGRDVVSIGERWSMAPFNYDWPSSLFASQDPIAIDSVALDFIRTEMFYELWENADRYLHEGAQADDPPSGTFYDPEDDGTRLRSLGVHEHWNNATAKQYTRNLGTGEGLELISSSPGVNALPVVALASPINGSHWPSGADVLVEADVSDGDGSIARVEFFDGNGDELGEDTTSPYELVWSGLPAGEHTVAARAIDDDGATKWSAAVTFTVGLFGDYNGDGHVDGDDFANFGACMAGAGQGYSPPACGVFDSEPDEDVDVADFAAFQLAFGT